MADFVAVIRRAVDGLSDNNAEMRLKVYEKARGAVRRQLESMNPRPSDDLVKRQLDKLETAINDVEVEHAEALPADDPAPEIVPEPVVEAVEPEPEPVETAAEVSAAVEEPEEQSGEAEPEHHAAPVPEHHAAPVPEAVEEPAEQVVDEPAVEEPPVEEPVAEIAAEQEQVTEPEPEPVVEAVSEEPAVEEAEPEPAVVEAHIEPSWQVEAEPASDYVPSWREPEHRDETPAEGAQSAATAAEVEPVADVDPVHDALVPDSAPVTDARMPAAGAQWDWDDVSPVATPADKQEPAVAAGNDPMAWEWPEEKATKPEGAKQDQPAEKSEWGDLDDLIGFTPKAAAAETTSMEQAGVADATATSPAVEARAPQRSFRAEPRKSRVNVAALAALVGVLAIAGGAGAAYWFNRDAVNGWVNEIVASVTKPSTPGTETPEAKTDTADGGRNLPATTTTNNTTPTDTQTDGAATKPATEVAAADQSSGKFTQRLLTDGTEVDEGPAAAPEGVTTEEGKSVAAQTPETAGAATETDAGTTGAGTATTDGATPATGTDGTTPTDTGTATTTTTDTQTPAATGEQPAAIGVTQKMFLYEERLGQTAPTAIEGTVAWSTAEESPGGDAKPEPVVRAQINVPSKGLTALITFRRNADKSLPASHIVELVFSLPESFEGGGIESVQRVAMKRTEQDRGDALIAVPAKITDDFHMIALNDFPEAITKNTELLRTRSWIDIPITYRNGRRALITLDKGTAGTEAFDKVMKAWSTAGTQ
ncbi:hypothetical protein MUO32_19760 [Shinella sp. CPCC 101442]|uniref:hypothetical protein n=1 Tax=Shinella sp. CPCC 101442 TaxID=2932265 RepID=UPI002153767A|nr:hypothetical protein [Shinella sp. CPCC 101442]MCR6501275.1 hypothetical protein [Shinella sp. CPCC 101442]